MITQDKNHIPPLRKPRGFSRQSYRSLTGKRQRHSERIICRQPLQCVFLNIWDNVPMDLEYVCQQYFTYMYMCFLGLIRYNKTFIACGYRKYESLFTHEYHIPLGRFPRGISKLPIKTIQPIKIIVLRHHIYFTILASFIFFFKSSKHFLQVDIEVGMMKT